MTPDAASLDRLNDLVLPEAVPWWPLAPGWYVVMGLTLGLVLFISYRFLRHRKANAYRRTALRELSASTEAAGIAELLRRTALVHVPRDAVARLTGSEWVEWLAGKSPEPMPAEVREMLATGIYGHNTAHGDIAILRGYAVRWVAGHQLRDPEDGRSK